MEAIKINRDQFKELLVNPNDQPFVMLNLLRFKKEGGQELYVRYLKEASRFVEEVGGTLLFFGRPKELLNGTEKWDLLMLIRYPSRKAFITMAGNPDYLKIHTFREEAVEDAVLYATDEISTQDLLTKYITDP